MPGFFVGEMAINIITHVSPKDRGFQYGDGFFTTAAIQNGKVAHWDLHLERLKTCQSRLSFPDIDWPSLTAHCFELSAKHSTGVLKVVITRGEGGRGYAPPEQAIVNVVTSISPFPTHYALWQQQGVRLHTSGVLLGHQPLLAGLKTLNRLEQVLIKQDAQNYPDYEDVLVCDLDNYVIESSAGNVLAYKGGQWFSPDLSKCGIQGVYLQSLMQHNNIAVEHLSLNSLFDMDAVFICNSLMHCVPVTAINEQVYDLSVALNAKSTLIGS